MEMDKNGIAEVFESIARLLELKGENVFKIRAYENGARALESLDEDLDRLIAEERLGEVKGIGKALVEKIESLRTTGRLEYYDKLKASVPPGLIEMLEIPGFGPKKILKVNRELGIDTIDELREACESGRIAELAGFGKKSAENILSGIRNREAYAKRHLWWDAHAVAQPIVEGLRALPEVERAEVAGSLRRGMETVGDLDFIVASSKPGPVMDWFVARPGVAEVTAHGETKSSVRFESGLQADLRVVPAAQFAYALHHFTGSKDHNVQMRQRALARGLSLSEWGLFPKDADEATRTALPIDAEDGIFAALGLHPIPPELREGRDEIEAAEKGGLPRLIEARDIRGVFHNHTNASDGRATLEEMAAAAQDRGWEYLGIADHSKASFQTNGLDEDRLARQIDAIAALNASGRFQLRLLAGCEVDILRDGSLDLPDAILNRLDYVVLSIHSAMTGLSEQEMTDRIVRALEHPLRVPRMLGHVSGRLLLRREPYKVDYARVIDAAARTGAIIELNANPHRLDMDWRHWKRAREAGVLCAINPDAHQPDHFDFMQAGILAARKAWLSPADVLNTRPLAAIMERLAPTGPS